MWGLEAMPYILVVRKHSLPGVVTSWSVWAHLERLGLGEKGKKVGAVSVGICNAPPQGAGSRWRWNGGEYL